MSRGRPAGVGQERRGRGDGRALLPGSQNGKLTGRSGPYGLIVIDCLNVVEQLYGGRTADGAECIHGPETMWPRAIVQSAGQPPRGPVSSDAAERLDRVQAEAEFSIPQGHFQQGDRSVTAASGERVDGPRPNPAVRVAQRGQPPSSHHGQVVAREKRLERTRAVGGLANRLVLRLVGRRRRGRWSPE